MLGGQDTDPEAVYLTEVDAAIMGDVIGHPYELPTPPELVYMQSSQDQDTIHNRIKRLIKRDLLETVSFETAPPQDSQPETFVGITEFGRTVFFRRVPEHLETTLKSAYAKADKPEHIRRFERAPRPPR